MSSSQNQIVRICSGKVFQDPIHGTIELHPLLVKIIDTPQFQRLRNIKQLGGKYFVYPGASHNRFEHCIGTAHLAGNLTRLLQRKHLDLIDDKDVLCVEIAGLCHDLGHGPFSHLFDRMYPTALKAQGMLSEDSKSHEQMSCEILDHLIEDNKLEEDLKTHEIDLDFVKEMINPQEFLDTAPWPYTGRGEGKSFLYEIVSNKRNNVDVDKWDYFARDCHHLGIKNSFDHERFMHCMRVLKPANERHQIGARDKESYNLYEMFHVRARLHRRAYQHRVGNVIDRMICDAFIEADDSDLVQKALGKKLSKCVNDPVAYTKLDDSIFQIILLGGGEASKILKRIQRRELYRYLGTVRIVCQDGDISGDIKLIAKKDVTLQDKDFVLIPVTYSYGMNDQNPVDNFHFYSKKNPIEPFKISSDEISMMLPSIFSESEVQVFYKSEDDKKCDVAEKYLEEFCQKDDRITMRTEHGKA